MESLKKRKKTHRYIEQTGGCQRREVDEIAESGQKVQTSSYKINKVVFGWHLLGIEH